MNTLIDTAVRSKLLAARGVMVLDLLSVSELAPLQAEAREGRRYAVEALDVGAFEPWDRGNPDRWLEQAPGGPVLDEYLNTDRLLTVLHDISATRWKPLGTRGSYSYYDRPGHYLGMHRDIVTCDLTCIICIDVQGNDDPAAGGGVLKLHPWAVRTPLDEVRTQRHRGIEVTLRPGQVAILLGGIIPHELTAIEGPLQRTVAPLCFWPDRS